MAVQSMLTACYDCVTRRRLGSNLRVTVCQCSKFEHMKLILPNFAYPFPEW